MWRLGVAVGASAVVTALTFLGIPAVGGVGAGIADPATRALLRQRFIERLHDYGAVLGVPAGHRRRDRDRGADAGVAVGGAPRRRLFLCLMVSWTALTIVAGIAQWLGAPVAGGRLTSYFFVVPILTGVLVWWLARRAAGWARPRAGATVAALVAAGVAVVAVDRVRLGGLESDAAVAPVDGTEGRGRGRRGRRVPPGGHARGERSSSP